LFWICDEAETSKRALAVDSDCEVTRMTDAERDAIHEHILRLNITDRKLSESLLHAMQERELLLRWMKNSSLNTQTATCHDFGDELYTFQ
jgi:hypothetical protein